MNSEFNESQYTEYVADRWLKMLNTDNPIYNSEKTIWFMETVYKIKLIFSSLEFQNILSGVGQK
jgi:hypothetical protein